MKRKSRPDPVSRDPLAGATRCRTLGAWLRFAEKLYAKHRLALGQIATDAHD